MIAFRHDINGLRAIAVIAVVLFHFQVPGFDAGYLGVDVFFVISGFLMAAILTHKLDNHNRKKGAALLWEFYIARARRTVPALAVLVVVLLGIGWWTLGPIDYEQLGIHARSTITFTSNFKFWEEAGYFDVASHEKWLLHTWSLSVEWQFYLLLPILFIALRRIQPTRKWLIIAVAAGCLSSLVYSIATTPKTPIGAFYLLPARMWELFAGVLVYLLSEKLYFSKRNSQILEALGLLLIVISIIFYGSDTPWPGSAATVPVVGTALVLLAARDTPQWATPVAVQWIGRASYSLYLWHWPVFVATVYLGYQGHFGAIVIGIIAAFIFAAISYHGIEKPSQRILVRGGPSLTTATVAFFILTVSAYGFGINYYDGLPDRMPDRFNTIIAETKNVNPDRDECHGGPSPETFPWCHFGGDDIQLVLVGDSHASMVLSAVRKALPNKNGSGMLYASYSSCQTLFGARTHNPRDGLECEEFNKYLQDRLSRLPSDIPLLVVNRLSAAAFGSHLEHDDRYRQPFVYFGDTPRSQPTPKFLKQFRKHLIDTICTLGQDRPVYWLRPTPEMPANVPRRMARKSLFQGSLAEVSITTETYQKRNSFVTKSLQTAEKECNLNLLDPEPYLCDAEKCYGSRNGLPIYYDQHHLSERGNKFLVPLFKTIFEDA